MSYIVTSSQLTELLSNAIMMAKAEENHLLGGLEYISKNKANSLFGFSNVNRWIHEGRIKPERLGESKNSKVGIKLKDLVRCKGEDAVAKLKIRKDE